MPGQRHRAVKCQADACPLFGDGNLVVNLTSGTVLSNVGINTSVYQTTGPAGTLPQTAQPSPQMFLPNGSASAIISSMEVLYAAGKIFLE